MEAILATQEQIMSAMDNLRTNFKKDGSERKTPAYIEKRLTTLDAYWNEFQLNHTRLSAEFDDPNHKYFSENYYQKAFNFYTEIKTLIKQYLTTEPTKPLLRPATPLSKVADQQDTTISAESGASHSSFSTSLTTQGNSSRVEEMLRKQKTNFKAFMRTIDAVDLDTMSEKWEFEDILKTIQSRWTVIDTLHWEIDNESVVDNEEYERAFNEYERKYNDVKKAVNSKMWSVSYREKVTPKMDIPTFNGNYQQWISFKDLFCETIHNNKSLPNAQKMQFLKTKLRGEADKLIQHLRISSDNYQICWDILNHRYQNMRLIFNSHIQTLLTISSMPQQSAVLIKKLHDTTNECLNAIKAMGVDITNWDPLIVYILTQKLDAETHHDYIESLRNPRDLPTIADFLEFLEIKFTSLESSRRKQDSVKPNAQTQYNDSQKRNSSKLPNNFIHKNFQHRPVINHTTTKVGNIATQRKCLLCNNNHALFQCKAFLESMPENRRKIIEINKLCKNCLVNHFGKACSSEKTCRFCNETHNTLLHNAYVTYAPSSSSNEEKDPQKPNVCVSKGLSETIPKLLATAKVNIKAVDGCFHTMRALIDPCAESSLITENAAQILGLPRIKRNCVVVGVGAKSNHSKGVIKITISSLYNGFSIDTEAYVMKQVVGNLPNQSFDKPSWQCLNKLQLADPEFYKSRPVDLILSVEVYEMILQPGFIRNSASEAIAQQTEFGWILSGTVQPQTICNVVTVELDNIQKFWEIEDISDNTLNMSSDDYQCIQQYQLFTKRQPGGRYVVRLPLKPEVTEKLGESRTKAVAQFRQLERRFMRHKTIANNYKEFIHEYVQLKHMTKCIGNQTPESYLPHHCVLRAESTTTATRVVFNASAKTSTGYSLNDLMYSGPNLQRDLLSLIIGWRQFRIAFTADIEKMFRQIFVHKDDQALQKIIWRDHPKQPLREYQLATVTYGTKAAPFLAMMTLRQLAKDEAQRFPDAANVVETSFYMDDLLHGHQTLESALKLKSDLIALLRLGGFNLRKWSSNKPELLDDHHSLDVGNQTYIFKHQEVATKGRLFHISVGEARHSVERRQAIDDVNYDDPALADEAGDDDTQNDTDNGDPEPQQEKVPAVIETAPTSYEVESGGDQRLECKVTPEEGTVVQWYRNNLLYFIGSISVHTEERYAIAPNSKDLLIKNAQVSDSGVFRCETAQKVPVAINHTLLVTEKPRVVNISASSAGYVGENSELTLTCHVTGSPVPTVLWSLTRKDRPNERLTEKDGEFSVQGNVYSLYIKNVQRDQAGKYYCYAFNKVGSHQAETVVVVNRTPRVHVPRTIVNSDINIQAELQCSAHEEARPHIRWYKDGALIEDSASNYKISTRGTHSNLTVTPTADNDFGTFTCEAENDYGKHNRSIELVQSPVVDNLEADGTKMTWTVHSHQPLEDMEVQLRSQNEDGEGEWRRLAVPLPEGRSHKYEVTYLLEDKQLETGEYQAIVKVKNSKSWGGSNDPVVVKIEDAQPQYIQHASVFRENSAHSIQPVSTVLSTILMYLLVRML